MFFTFHQNNSGGSFTGPAKFVIIEAENAETANALAEVKGLYFDGCETGEDCPCCGDRWYRVGGYDGNNEPMIYGWKVDFSNVEKFVSDYKEYSEFENMPIIQIYHIKYNAVEEY